MTEVQTQEKTAAGHESKFMAEVKDWVRTFVGAAIVFIVFTTVAFAQYSIPSESMVPTLEVGDRVIVSKYSYGYSRYSLALPFEIDRMLPSGEHRLFERMPKRGDVVVFIHPLDGKTMIKRLIGLPGDVIELREGVLSINGVQLPREDGGEITRQPYKAPSTQSVERFEETLPEDVRHPIHQDFIPGDRSTFGPFRVPDREFFFMGDNRDNSLDSRWWGPVPMENLIGRAETVVVTLRGCGEEGSTCRPRWLKPLHD